MGSTLRERDMVMTPSKKEDKEKEDEEREEDEKDETRLHE